MHDKFIVAHSPPFTLPLTLGFYKECRTLAQDGYDVVLVVPHDKANWLTEYA